MKVILIRKDGKRESYTSAAVLVEPTAKDDPKPYAIGERAGVVQEVPLFPPKGFVYAIYDVVFPARYHKRVSDFLAAQVGKKVRRSHWWLRYVRDRKRVQDGRRAKGEWSMPELVMAAFHKAGCVRLFAGQEPFEMTASYLSRSPSLYFRGLLRNREEAI